MSAHISRSAARAGFAAIAAITMVACHRSQPVAVMELPSLPQISQPSESPMVTSPRPRRSGTGADQELRVDIDTHGTAVDVRQVLAFLADKGKLNLVFAPGIEKKVRLQLRDVPVSEALQAVLAAAGLTLESTNGAPALTPSTSVVFYQLPVNVDSLPADAIMRRFGVGRVVADLIVQSRMSRP